MKGRDMAVEAEGRATPRDRLRRLISEELDRRRPLEVSRSTLELLAETSVHLAEKDGELAYTVVDGEGNPRTRHENGRPVALSIRDLVAELHEKHPTLFEPEQAAQPAGEEEAPARSGTGPGGRDWLDVAGVGKAPDEASSAPAAGGARHPSPGERGVAVRDYGLFGWTVTPHPVGSADSTSPSGRGGLLRALADKFRAVPARIFREPEPAPLPPIEPRRRIPPSRYVYAAVAGALALALLGPLLSRSPTREQPAEPPATGAVAEPEAQRAATTAPDQAAPPPAGLNGVPEVIDTATLRLGGKIVRLHGVEWARGGAAEDMRRYLAGREVDCELAAAPDRYRCRVGGQDLSKVVLFNGGGRASSDAPPELVAAEEHARTERLGVWGRSPP
jgi:endonuclease YncB( thermonuclease family)